MGGSLHDGDEAPEGEAEVSEGSGVADRVVLDFEHELAQLDTSSPVLVLVETVDGCAQHLIERIPESRGPVSYARGTEADRARVGAVAEELRLNEVEPGTVMIENSQWVDPTSLGRLQRMIKAQHPGLLVVLAHRPLSDVNSWSIDQIRSTAARFGTVIDITADKTGSDERALPEERQAGDLVLAAGFLSSPLAVSTAARFLGVAEGEALVIAEDLVKTGHLRETRGGFAVPAGHTATGVGEARLGYIAGRLATVLEDSDADEAVVGTLRLAAGDHRAAYPHLVRAAREAERRGALGEAFHLASSALSAAEEAGLGADDDSGHLHLISGRYLRQAGRSEMAAAHLEKATALLKGVERIDALGFAAAVADDLQHPQDSERIIAMAELEAARQDEGAKLGSLGTFRSRALNRIGFASEADALLEKSAQYLTGAGPTQQYYASMNRAWISFDRGQASKAEMEFTRLRDLASSDDSSALAETEAWRARALFAAGRPADALQAVNEARRHAALADVEAPLFLADLALTEGNLLFARYPEALEANERVLDLVERQLPAWANVAHAERASALLGLGRLDEASDQITTALERTPAGSNGWRWRARSRAIQIEIAARAGKGWNQQEADDLADLFLQSQFYGWAAEMLCVIAEQGKSKGAAAEAMALAHQIGNPMLAARAAAAGKLWSEPSAAPVIRAIRAIDERIPESWRDSWLAVPAVEQALAAPEPAVEELGDENLEVLETALRRAGLSGADVVLSPAQRRKKGLVRRRYPRRRLQLVAAVIGVIVLATATSIAVAQLQEDPEPVAAAPLTLPPEELSLEETEIPLPGSTERIAGTAEVGGGPGRTGFFGVDGPRTVDGFYWSYRTADPIEATPAAYGNNLLVGSTDGTFYALDQTTGRVAWSLRTEGPIWASPALVTATVSEGGAEQLVVFVSDDGIVRARATLTETADQLWASEPIGRRIRSAPLAVDDRVFVASADGVVHALSVSTGEEIWRFPTADAEPADLGAISAPLAYQDGVLYVATEAGSLHLIDGQGQQICQAQLSGPVVASPMISGDTAYIGTRARIIHMLPVGQCETPVTETRQYLAETAITVAPAIVENVMYITSGRFLYQVDLTTNEDLWPPDTVFADSTIVSSPVVANDTVYFGTQAGTVYAVDAVTGEELWTWRTGNYVRASPVVVDGVVFIASGDGNVYAVGPEG